MGNIKPNQRIYDVIRDIKDQRYRLPSIQRSFVWDQDRICKLMDSLMSDYPIGSFLVWKPNDNLKVRSRRFVLDYREGDRLVSDEQPVQPTPYLVLDGQQRLQSLVLSFFGRYDDKFLYFKLDSDPDKEENDLKYRFQFMTPEQAEEDEHWVRPASVVGLKIEDIPEFVAKKFPHDSDTISRTVTRNLGRFIRVFNADEKLPIQDVLEDLPYNDVLEVFVRVNSGGMVLTKSDLVFSTIVLNRPDMERKFIELVDELNGGGEFDFDTDFMIKTSFVLFDKGAKYDVDKLKDKEYLDDLEDEFEKLRKTLLSGLEFLKSEAKMLSKRFLKSDLALIPVLDFIYRQPHQQLPEGQASKLRQYLYMSLLMRFYSHGADARLDVLHNKIKKSKNPQVFPRKAIAKYMAERTGIDYKFSREMLGDLDLVLNIVQGGVSEIPKRRGWSLERDHVFPDSMLEKKGFQDELINSVGNLRLINKTRNILKSDEMPENGIEFFGSDVSELRKLFLVARSDLTKANFSNFVQKRADLIFARVVEFLGDLAIDQ